MSSCRRISGRGLSLVNFPKLELLPHFRISYFPLAFTFCFLHPELSKPELPARPSPAPPRAIGENRALSTALVHIALRLNFNVSCIGHPVLRAASVCDSLGLCFPINFLLSRVLEGSTSKNICRFISLGSPLPLSPPVLWWHISLPSWFPSCPPSNPLFTEQLKWLFKRAFPNAPASFLS